LLKYKIKIFDNIRDFSDVMAAIRLNCRWSGGRQTLSGLTTETTLQELTAQIWSVSGVEPSDQILRSGYPPMLLELGELSKTLSSAGISNGEVISVETKSKKEFVSDEKTEAKSKTSTESASKVSSPPRRIEK
jgi:hypothetical protein